MSSLNRFPRRKGKANKIKKEFSTDSIDVLTGTGMQSMGEIRRKYIHDNAIQVKAPAPANVAMDSSCSGQQYQPNFNYVNQYLLSYYVASSSFIGYHAMALIAQHWLVMKGCSQKACDAMKKGYELTKNDGSELTPKESRQIAKLDKKYKIDHHMKSGVAFNNVFGIRHILFKSKDPNFNYEEPFNPDAFKNGKYAGIVQVDPYWITPVLADEALSDPASLDYYEPEFWDIQGKRYHKSHFVILRGEEVADYLKPTYRYGGISLTQKVYERVYAGERTANEIPQLAMTKRLNVRKTDLAKAQANKAQFIENLNVMNEFRDNYGVQVVGNNEDINQLETSLTNLDKVMWAEYHLVSSIFDVPVSKLYGTGHNGFSTGETDEDYYISSLEALQSGELDDIAYGHYQRLMPSEFGEEMDLDIVWHPMKVQSESDKATTNFTKAQTDQIYWNIGAVGDVDVRDRLIGDKESGYSGMEKLEAVAEDEYAEDYVREEDGQWFVYSEEGKRLSRGYASKEDAEKRLGQIEYFKYAKDEFDEYECLDEMCGDVHDAEYQGKSVQINKPFRTPGESKKYAVYVKDGSKVKIVRFGDPNMEIRRDNEKARENFRSRHDCENKTDKTKPGYWSCKFWSTKSVSSLLDGD